MGNSSSTSGLKHLAYVLLNIRSTKYSAKIGQWGIFAWDPAMALVTPGGLAICTHRETVVIVLVPLPLYLHARFPNIKNKLLLALAL